MALHQVTSYWSLGHKHGIILSPTVFRKFPISYECLWPAKIPLLHKWNPNWHTWSQIPKQHSQPVHLCDSDSCVISPALLRARGLEQDLCRTRPCGDHGYASAEIWFPIRRLPWKNITHSPDKTNMSTSVRRPDKNLIIYPLFNMRIQYLCLHFSYLWKRYKTHFPRTTLQSTAEVKLCPNVRGRNHWR